MLLIVIPALFLVPTPSCYVTTSVDSYADEMSSRQTTPHTRNLSYQAENVTPTRVPPPPAMDTSPSACWDWLLFPPTSYPELYTCVYPPPSPRPDNHDDGHLCASLPTCLLALLYSTLNLSNESDDENESDQEISTLQPIDEPLSTTTGNISSTLLLSSAQTTTSTESKRSSTPDTDDGYQSASDASRSDYSQTSSGASDSVHVHEPSIAPRISYAAAVKPLAAPITTCMHKSSSSITTISKGKQTMNNSLSTVSGASDNYTNNNSQKIKFIAPRFERIHHAKQQQPSGSSAARSTHAGRRR